MKYVRRLYALGLKAEGHTGKKIPEITGHDSRYILKLTAKYHAGMPEAIVGNRCGGNHRSMGFGEEAAFPE